mmetsp:Transcript_9488/g.25261  ORF Transcript_9488/g.25261 Transcript_9488/m.25261 type:complete len:614 (+) Transcript_9488:79-1920(+)
MCVVQEKGIGGEYHIVVESKARGVRGEMSDAPSPPPPPPPPPPPVRPADGTGGVAKAAPPPPPPPSLAPTKVVVAVAAVSLPPPSSAVGAPSNENNAATSAVATSAAASLLSSPPPAAAAPPPSPPTSSSAPAPPPPPASSGAPVPPPPPASSGAPAPPPPPASSGAPAPPPPPGSSGAPPPPAPTRSSAPSASLSPAAKDSFKGGEPANAPRAPASAPSASASPAKDPLEIEPVPESDSSAVLVNATIARKPKNGKTKKVTDKTGTDERTTGEKSVAGIEHDEPPGTFFAKLKNLIDSLQKPKPDKAKEEKKEDEVVELTQTKDEKTGDDVVTIKREVIIEPKNNKERAADVIDLAVAGISKAPDIRLIFVAELLLVFLCIAIWPPLVQNIGVAILFPPVLLATALASVFWQRTPDAVPDLVYLRVPPELSEDLSLRVKVIKEKGAELDRLVAAIYNVQKEIRAMIPRSDGIDVKVDTIFRILDQSDHVLHEELLVVPENVDVLGVEDTGKVVPVKPKVPKAPVKQHKSAPSPTDMTSFLNAMFYPQKTKEERGTDPINARKKKKLKKELSKREAASSKENAEVPTTATTKMVPEQKNRKSDVSSRRESGRK